MKSPPISAQRAAVETSIAKFASLTPRILGMRESERALMMEHLRAALETMRLVDLHNDWQTIDNTAKDGNWVVLNSPEWRAPHVCRWEAGRLWHETRGHWWTGFEVGEFNDATVFIPLPKLLNEV